MPEWARFLVFSICVIGIGSGIAIYLHKDISYSVTNIPIVRQLDPICSVGSRVAVQDASETKSGVQGRVILYKCVQDKPRWEPE